MEQFRHILFIDIETVSSVPRFDLLSTGMQEQWARKAKYLKRSVEENKITEEENNVPALLFEEKAGIFSEFAKVVCIGLGCLVESNGEWNVLLKSITDDDEKKLLIKFCETLSKFHDRFPNLQFCGHNIKEFDMPFLSRRMVIHGMQLPDCLQLHGKKPWEITHLDTLELWRFGDYKHFTSLALLAEVLGIPSPKDDIDGSMVSDVYWKENNPERIARYCLQDVYTTARVYFRLKGINNFVPDKQFVAE